MTSSPSGTLNSSFPDAINIAHDPMQNPGQTQIFYKAGQTRMTQQKRDPVDPTQFQPWTEQCTQAWQALKDALCSSPVLRSPDFHLN